MFFSRSAIVFVLATATTLVKAYSGDGTFYQTGLGACGITNSDSNSIVAVSAALFDSFSDKSPGNPNTDTICKRGITIHYGGVTAQATITDRCVACAYGDIDMSPSLFSKFAPQSVGRIHGVSWSFN